MAIKTSLKEGDLIQFPSCSLKKILRLSAEWIVFGAMRKSKKGTTYSCHAQKRSIFSKSFVIDHCYLVPSGIDLQSYLNETHSRRPVAAPSINAYSTAIVLEGYIIDDEEILDMPPVEEDD